MMITSDGIRSPIMAWIAGSMTEGGGERAD
jgi:hypothetical protein